MKIAVACDSFKGTFSSLEIANHIENVAKIYFEEIKVEKIAVADGGEGTIDALLHTLDGSACFQEVFSPLGEKITAKYGYIDSNKTALIEMAQASGLFTIPEDAKNPLKTSSYGTGQLISNALEKGVKKIILGLGGSATNDGGMGVLAALGARFYDAKGKEIKCYAGESLSKVSEISLEEVNSKALECEFEIMCDVDNILTGPNGATYVFGPQKGATVNQLRLLEEGMVKYSRVLERCVNKEVGSIKGSGAAGGVAAAMLGVFNGKISSGIDIALDLMDFDKKIADCQFVITGEGKMDKQTLAGKVPYGISKRCKALNIPVIGFVGGLEMNKSGPSHPEELYTVFSVVSDFTEFSTIQKNPEKYLIDAIHRMFKFIKLGYDLKSSRRK
ncbi:glycerate kinase [Proteinivorax hydrogeniformans]|uniref:Glycerate kinase n=1 Tax=Proteinivorax hydrogeniformans TaxID=1826727 RepID=A0AAU8HVX1_9FIRM